MNETKFCMHCGMALMPGETVCPNCHTPVKPGDASRADSRSGNDGQSSSSSYYSHPETSLNVVLSEGEKVVKRYLCTDLVSPMKTSGYLTVTNKRVVFEGIGTSGSMNSRLTQETALDGISGINSFYGYDIHIKLIIAGIFFILSSFYSFYVSGQVGSYSEIVSGRLVFAGFVMLVIGVLLIYAGIQKCFILTLLSSKSEGTGITIGTKPSSMIGNGALYSMSGRPTQETDLMMSELGAMIQDLQSKGDLAARKWMNP